MGKGLSEGLKSDDNPLLLGCPQESSFVRALMIAEEHAQVFRPVLYRHYRLE